MKLLKDGTYAIEMDNRLLELTKKEKEAKVSEDEFRTALKGYRIDEFLTALAEISVKLFDRGFTENEVWKKEKDGFIIHKPSKQFVTDFAVEYIANILLISGSNNFKSESIKNKDNIIGLFSIYHNSIMQPIDKLNSAQSILVPIFYQQITSQQDIKDVFIRQWLIFQKSQKLVNKEKKIDLDQILINESGMSVIEYIKLCFLILAVILTKPRFSFGTIDNSTIPGLGDVLNKQKISEILKQLSVTQDEFIKLDKKYNSQLKPEYTKSRYNPLWEKPIIKLGNNDYVVPSLSAYVKGAMRGLYWIFENLKGKLFRDYFGTLFEKYCGMVVKDIFGTENVRPGIKFGKENKEFFDWIVNNKGEVLLFETKGYQFPLKALQTGNPSLIRKEVFNKLVETIKQTYQRCQDIKKNDELKEFKGKKKVVIGVFYDIPFVSTNLYDVDIKLALNDLISDYPGIKDFKYIFLSIEELEDYAYVKDCISIESLVDRVGNTPGSGVLSEISIVFKENKLLPEHHKNLLDRKFKDFYNQELGMPYSKKE
jgi:hypothetical protein